MSNLSRRSFLKLAGVTAAAAVGTSMLTGCSLVEYVTIIPVLNGEELGESTEVPMPGFVSDYKWAFDLAMPIVKKQYADIPGFDQVEFKLDPEYSDHPNCKVITDPETGKKVMYIAIKCNVIEGTIYVRNAATNESLYTFSSIQLPDSLQAIPEEYAEKYLEQVAEDYPAYDVTLAERADNLQVVKSVDGKSFEAFVYVNITKKA